jgi:hypothetical protein
MNKAPSYRISLASRSADVARVSFTLGKTDSKAPGQCRNHGRDIGAHPLTLLFSNNGHPGRIVP